MQVGRLAPYDLACYDCNFDNGYLSWKRTAIEILNWWLNDGYTRCCVLGLCAPIVPPVQLKPMFKDEPFIISLEPILKDEPSMHGIWIWSNGDTTTYYSDSFGTVRQYEHNRAKIAPRPYHQRGMARTNQARAWKRVSAEVSYTL